jgi:hypothetical protein
MKTKLTISILVAMVFAMVFGAVAVSAAVPEEPTTFWLSHYYFVKGDELNDDISLSRDAPVTVHFVKDGAWIGLASLQYRQRVEATLPAGSYEFIFNDQTGAEIFTCGPYEFDGGDIVHMQAHEQGPGREPDCYTKID